MKLLLKYTQDYHIFKVQYFYFKILCYKHPKNIFLWFQDPLKYINIILFLSRMQDVVLLFIVFILLSVYMFYILDLSNYLLYLFLGVSGMVVTYSMGAFLHWRTIAWATSVSVLLPMIMMSIWSPESPVWLVSRGRNQDALRSLTYLSRREKEVSSLK